MIKSKQLAKKVKCSLLFILIFSTIIFIMYIAYHTFKPRVAGTEVYKVVSLSESQAQSIVKATKEKGEFYTTIEDAIIKKEAKNGMKLYEEIYTFTKDADMDIHVILGKKKGVRFLNLYATLKDNGKVSKSIRGANIRIDKEYWGIGYNLEYTKTDVIGWSITDSFLHDNMFAYANNGMPIYYGVAKEKDIYGLRILDEPPSNIIPFEFEEIVYYFWYYDDINIKEELKGKMDFNSFTLNEIAELLDIKFVDDE